MNAKKKFASSSEKSEYIQVMLFNEVECETDSVLFVEEPEIEEITIKRKKTKRPSGKNIKAA